MIWVLDQGGNFFGQVHFIEDVGAGTDIVMAVFRKEGFSVFNAGS